MRVLRVEDGLDGVDRARPDVAEHDAERADHQGRPSRLTTPRLRGQRFGLRVHRSAPRLSCVSARYCRGYAHAAITDGSLSVAVTRRSAQADVRFVLPAPPEN